MVYKIISSVRVLTSEGVGQTLLILLVQFIQQDLLGMQSVTETQQYF